MQYIILAILILIPATSHASINMHAIAQIESSGNPNAVGDGGKALGLYQLHAGVVSDYNRRKGTNHSHRAALNPRTAHQIASWYLQIEIPRLLRHYGQPVTTINILRAYNQGIASVAKNRRMAKITKNYINKYKKLTK